MVSLLNTFYYSIITLFYDKILNMIFLVHYKTHSSGVIEMWEDHLFGVSGTDHLTFILHVL